MAFIRWSSGRLEKLKTGSNAGRAVTVILVTVLIVWPAWTAYASAPHYAIYTNVLGSRYAAYFFPHDEFYDDGLNEAIRFVCEQAPRNATIVTETPGVIRYYTEKFGRTDLQSRVLSDPKYSVSETEPAYVILQRGRTYFENQNEMKEVHDRFTLVYAGCVEGHTAAEVYAVPANPSAGVNPCGDLRP
jgi:hypothetical protein